MSNQTSKNVEDTTFNKREVKWNKLIFKEDFDWSTKKNVAIKKIFLDQNNNPIRGLIVSIFSEKGSLLGRLKTNQHGELKLNVQVEKKIKESHTPIHKLLWG